jgi:hypothetical protein
MDRRFLAHVKSLRPSIRKLVGMKSVAVCNRVGRDIPKQGVYLLSEGRRHLYVGRSDDMHQRLARHFRKSSRHNAASFAFLLAREISGNPPGTRAQLMENRRFLAAFKREKVRIRDMRLRFVRETDPTRQALLEIYVAVVLRTPYNDFETH